MINFVAGLNSTSNAVYSAFSWVNEVIAFTSSPSRWGSCILTMATATAVKDARVNSHISGNRNVKNSFQSNFDFDFLSLLSNFEQAFLLSVFIRLLWLSFKLSQLARLLFPTKQLRMIPGPPYLLMWYPNVFDKFSRAPSVPVLQESALHLEKW